MNMLRLSADLSLPEGVAGQTLAVLGIRGSGKTNTAGVIAEELLDRHHQIAVIDPTDGWWGLRSEYPVIIFGGSHADLPLDEFQGKTIAEFVVTERVPVILATAELRKTAQRKLVADFCGELFHLKSKQRSPLTVIIDEAPLFVPQKVFGEDARTVGAVEDLVARGRNKGFGLILISQRSATINKDVLTQADTMIVHRLTGLPDRKVLAEWMQANATAVEHKTALEDLAGLGRGDAWVWAPGLSIFKRVHVRARHTFDSSASPEAGKTLAPPRRLAEIDLKALKGKMAVAVEQKKANDPALLKKQIAHLEHLLQTQERQRSSKHNSLHVVLPAPPKPPRFVKQRVLFVPKGWARQLAAFHKDLRDLAAKAAFLATQAEAQAGKELGGADPSFAESMQPSQRALNQATRLKMDTLHRTLPLPHQRAQLAAEAGVPDNNGSVPLRAGARRMLRELAARYPGVLSRAQVGALARIAYTSGTFTTYIGDLKRTGYIEESGDQLKATGMGIASLKGDVPSTPTSHEQAMAAWRKPLRAGAYRMLEAVVAAGNRGITKSQIAEQAQISEFSGTFTTYLGDLRRNGLITEQGGVAVACDILFPS